MAHYRMSAGETLRNLLEGIQEIMKKLGKLWKVIGVWIILLVLLAGCGRRSALDRVKIEQVEAFTIDVQQTPQLEADTARTSCAQTEPPEAATTAETAAATPTPNEDNGSASAELDQLLNELEETLNGLEASTEQTDRDTLTDSTLAELGK